MFTKQNTSGSLFESTNDEPVRKTDFEGMLDISSISSENPIYAVYPFSEDASFDGIDITTTLPSEQEAVVDGFADHLLPAMAVSDNLNLSFYQIATGIRFTVAKDGVKKIIFRGNKGEAVSGKFKVRMNDDGRPEVQDAIESSQWVTLTAPKGGMFETGKMYYLSVLPNYFETGFTLTFLTDI